MMHYFTKKIFFLVAAILLLTGGVAYAETPDVKQALEDTKESVEDLVAAKDENSPFDTAFRIQAFKQVLELSLSEAKDLKIRLIAFDKIEDEEIIHWKDQMIEGLNSAIFYYEEQKLFIEENEGSIDLEQIQNIALEFKNWREENFLPVSEQVQDFLFINKSDRAFQIANKRWGKIKTDLELLETLEIKEMPRLWAMLDSAHNLIKSGGEKNQEAHNLFLELYVATIMINASSTATSTVPGIIEAVTEETSTSTATTTNVEETVISTVPGIIEAVTEETSTSTATTTNVEETVTSTVPGIIEAVTEETSTSTATSTNVKENESGEGIDRDGAILDQSEAQPELSIKDLVRSSLEDVKKAYQVFIEMSSLVRKLLS